MEGPGLKQHVLVSPLTSENNTWIQQTQEEQDHKFLKSHFVYVAPVFLYKNFLIMEQIHETEALIEV